MLRVGGMDCSSCAETIENVLRRVEGVADARADVVGGRVTVAFGRRPVATDVLAAAVRRAGYRVEDGPMPAPGRSAPPRAAASTRADRWREPRVVLAALAGVLWLLTLIAPRVGWGGGAAAVLALGAVAAAGRYVFPRGLRAARTGSLDMHVLMSVAAIGALLIGEYAEAASVLFLFAVAQLLETFSMERARDAIRSLMELSPAETSVLRGGREERVAAESVAVGEVVVVRPGEKVPVDGTVLAGGSGVNQAPITGESLPVDKGPGSQVFAGTLNGEGVLEVRATRPAADTTLARIIHAVEDAQSSRAPSQTFVERFARVYTPAVVGAALAVAVLPPLAGLGAWGDWGYRALVLLVVACPCALVISTPVTIVSALAGAARRGILIKGGLHLEKAARARIVAIDKTGTLTHGCPEVVEVLSLDGAEPAAVLALAAAAEARSEHPLARAVLRRAAEAGLDVEPGEGTVALPGRGVRARVGPLEVLIGSERLLAECGADLGEAGAALRAREAAGRTAVLVATRSPEDSRASPTVRGILVLADRLRSPAAGALAALRDAGIERVVMLTGDNAATARAVATSLGGPGLGVDEIRADLLPEDKVAAVRELRAGHEGVVMVGDGVNDAPALAAADVGIAMGTAGTDVALETADIALMADDLSKLPVTIGLARKAESIIRVNIAFALAVKAAFVVLSVAGLATLWMAVLADMGASLLVVGNGLRALRPSTVRRPQTRFP